MRKTILLSCILCAFMLQGCAQNIPAPDDKDNTGQVPGGDSGKDDDKDDESGLSVLCLGNSITKHAYKEDIEWYSDWGMAASKEEYDYCHQLEKLMGRKYPGTKVTPMNIADWERDMDMDLDQLLDKACEGKDIIVIRLGENVQDKEAFQYGIQRLVSYCKSKVKQVYITGCFWKDNEKEAAIKAAAAAYDIPYISLEGIDQPGVTRPQVGDILYDVNGKPYSITRDFIIAHPNDKGMKMIARQIMSVILEHIDDYESASGYSKRAFILENPRTFVFLPASDKATGRAVVACPGGGYTYCEPTDNYEGNGWASFFNDRGIALIVVKYTLPGGNCRLPIDDVERTVRLVREHSDEWHINKDDVGIMGFSAGGHLASTIATHSTGDAHPDFQILFYPVITMGTGTHQGSRDNFLGKNPSAAQIELYSNEKQVKADTPHAFITFTEDDTIVPPAANGMPYYQALTEKGIAAELVSWPSSSGWGGGHGWGNLSTFVHHDELISGLSDWLETF